MIEDSIVYRDMKKYNFFKIKKAEGSLIWDRNGKRYIDFTSGWNVTNLGWNHPEVNEAVIKQAEKNTQGLIWGSVPVQEEYAAKLLAALPKYFDACTKATGGTEAIEESIKIARAATGKKKILGFKKSYHGQLFAALALGNSNDMVPEIAPLVPDFLQLDFPDEKAGEANFKNFLANLDSILSKRDVAALVAEPGIITGYGSTRTASSGFLTEIRKLTQKYGTLLIVDEVGTGFSRTGKLFGIEHEKVVPDMIVFAKAISNGVAPIGTAVGNSEIFNKAVPYSILTSTFGWLPVTCAAALKTLEVHQRDKVWEQAEEKGKYIIEKLKEFVGGPIVDLRGKGMEIGFSLKDAETARKVIDIAFERGLHIVIGSESNIQIMPPLTIPQDLIDEGLEILISTLKKI